MEKNLNFLGIVFLLSFVYSVGSSQCLRNYECVRQTYLKEVGVREVGWNRGARVEEYLKAVDRYPGDAWCAAFVVWCHQQCDVFILRTGWAPSLFPKKYRVYDPRRGDVFGLYFASKKRVGHVGFVEKVEDKYYVTVEGNTGPDNYGPRTGEGDGVYKKRRLKRQVTHFSRWY